MADVDDNIPSSFIPHKKNDVYDINSKIMLTAIISLLVVVILVVLLHIYARCVLHRQARRRRIALIGRIRSMGLTGDNQQPQPKAGLDPMVINSLPMFVFKQSNKGNDGKVARYNGGRDDDDDDDASVECAVCLSMLEDEEIARLLPNCNHTFHAECIDKWLASHSTCPMCRMEAEPQPPPLQPEPREGPAAAMENVDSATSPFGQSRSLERVDSMEGTAKVNNGSSSRLSSFRRILSRERSIRRIQTSEEDDDRDRVQDLETQR